MIGKILKQLLSGDSGFMLLLLAMAFTIAAVSF